MAARPLGVFGGTFDPVHMGNLRLAEEACAALGLARVLWLPAGRPPHRPQPETSAEHRLEMVRLAIAANPRFTLDAQEVRSDAPSYTVITLENLRQRLGAEQPLVLLLGADAYAGLTAWHRWSEIFSLAHLGVASRSEQSLEPTALPAPLGDELRVRHADADRDPVHAAATLAARPAGRIATFALIPLDISATRIRTGLAAGLSPRYLLPDPVLYYIERHRLYRPSH